MVASNLAIRRVLHLAYCDVACSGWWRFSRIGYNPLKTEALVHTDYNHPRYGAMGTGYFVLLRRASGDNDHEESENPMKKTKSNSRKGKGGGSGLIDARIKERGDWRGETLARVRTLVKQADPEVVEEVKWRKPSNSMLGVPVWSHAGIICTGETYKNVVKLTFANGASLADPSGLFNSSLEGNTRRAIDFHEGDKIDEKGLKALIRAAVALNTSQ